VARRTRVVKLSPVVQALVPSLLVPTLSKSTRGVSFQSGRAGLGLGAIVLATGIGAGWLLSIPTGVAGFVLMFWLVGTTGVAMVLSSFKPLAFVKPICTRCRLLPVIVEHEAIHLSGVSREGPVWASMRQRHSVESLGLSGDPAICSFCPIPKRLSEG